MVEIEARRGDAVKADAALKTLVAKHPNRVEAALASANLAMSRGQYATAVAAFRTALSREETTGNALALARAHLAAGEPGKAAAFLDGWAKARPNDLPAQMALAWILSKPVVTAPIIGASKMYQLEDALGALSVTLSADEIKQLEEPYQPHPVLGHS